MATEQDAARERVLAARADLRRGGRSARGVRPRGGRYPRPDQGAARPRPRRSPAALGFLALKGPQRIFGVARAQDPGRTRPTCPSGCCPRRSRRRCASSASDGDKVRGALERDFADYAKKSHKEREGLKSVLLLAVARPLLGRGAKAAGDLLFSPDPEGFSGRLAQVRAQAAGSADRAREGAERAGASAKDRIAAARRDRATQPPSPADETAPTGI